jgi:uncharacterized protein (DUF433 family)
METLQLQQYDEWIADHLDELVAQYAGQVVAIHQGKIAIIGGSEVDVYRKIREVGLEPMPLVLRVPRVSTPTVDIGTLIIHTPDVRGGRARIVGTGVTVQRIVGWYKLGLSPEEIAEELGHLTLAQVHAALAYYHANREEIESAIAADDAKADELVQRHHQTAGGRG